ELATGRRPWPGTSPVQIALAQSRAPRPDPRALRPDLPAALAIAIRRCLDPDPDARYGAAGEGAADPAPAAAGGERRAPGPTADAVIAVAARPARDAALAVLPFRRAPDDDYLAEGLVEDVIDTLSMTAGLRVRPLGVVARVEPGGDPCDAGRALDVEHVVEGSMRRTATGLRITTRLVNVGDGFQVWAQRTDCAPDAVLEVGAA